MKIILSVVAVLFLVACNDGSKIQNAKEDTQTVSKITADVIKEKSAVVEKEVKAVIEVAQKKSAEIVKKTEEVVVVAAQKVEEVSADIAKVAPVVEKEIQKVTAKSASTVDGAKIFAKCAGCHGAHGDRKALGKSQIIASWDASKTITALNGYKDGSYGSSMKGVMKSQVSNLSDTEIQAVAKYISGL